MSPQTLNQARAADAEALKAAAFDLSPDPSMVVDAAGALAAVNEAAEALFGHGLSLLARGRFLSALPPGSAMASLLERARVEGARVRERGIEISLFGLPPFEADGAAAPLGDGSVLLTLSIKTGLGVERNGAEAAGLTSIMGLGRMLAHEIKNPLAGIRGAAQLLKGGAKAEDQPLAQLIMDETDRVTRLVDRMEEFSEEVPAELAPVNIHEVLDRVRALAANGAADGLVMREYYDPSLPPVLGDEDQLIQVFLNLVKNAAEALERTPKAEVRITTAFRPGIRIAVQGVSQRISLPLEIVIEDNGPGIPADLLPILFDPFVTTKANGSGLGLALVAKIVGDHGGVIDSDSRPGRTRFRVLLPVAKGLKLPEESAEVAAE